MKNIWTFLALFLLPCILSGAPVPYAGKVAINGANFQGDAQFTFALRDANGVVRWRNGVDADSFINVPVDRGLYVVLLGGQGMQPIPNNLFLEHPELYLQVRFFRLDTGQWLHLQPDQRINSAPHALAAEVARNALTADAVKPGAITKSMLASDVLADLNATVVLPEQNATIQTGSITRDMLAPNVLSDLNATVAPGSITRQMLSQAVLADLNRTITITRSMLPASVQADLNRTITRGDLPSDVLADLNRTITRNDLPPSVLADLNRTVVISRDMLPASVLADLNRTITRGDLPADVLADLNRSVVITRNMLPGDVLADLNRTITRNMLAPGVRQDLNRTITRNMLPVDVLADLNNTVTRDRLAQDILSDLNASITLGRLSPEVLAALQVTPSISTQPFARYDWKIDSATIQVSGRGHNLSYQWLKDGQPINGATAPVLELANPTLDDNATYAVRLTNSVGQATSQTLTLQSAIGAPGLPLAEANGTQVPRNGLVLWLDANDLNADGLADNLPTGTLIDSWKSKVGDANATQSTELLKPKSNFFGDTNLKAVAFDGGDYLLDDNASLPVQHIFFVYRGAFTTGIVMFSDNSTDLVKIHSDNGFKNFQHTGFYTNVSQIRVSGQSTSQNTSSYYGWRKDILSLTAGSGGSYNGTFAKLGIGAKTANSSNWEGEVGEILFYNRALSNSERDAVEQHLAQKWGITLYAAKLAAEQAAYNAAKPPDEPENGLQAYYKFEPVSVEPTKLWDHSGNDRHLTLSGFDGDPWVDGVDGKGLSFDGGNSKAYAGSNSGIDPGTIAFWANPVEALDASDNPNIVTYFRSGNSANQYLGFNKLIEGQGRHFALWQSSKTSTVKVGAINQAPSGWLHIAITYDENSSTYNLFLNGQPLETVHYNSGHPRIDPYKNFTIGNTNAPFYRGLLDDFRIYNRSLTPAEIEGLYLQVNSPIIRMAPEHNATVGTNFSLSLAADNGPTTYLAEGLPAGLSLNVTTGQITGTLSQPGYHRVFVKAMNEHGTGSDVIAIVAYPQTDQNGWPVDVPDGSDIPQNGMVLWLDANDVDADGQIDSGTDHLKLANWADKAGQDNNATQAVVAHQPEVRTQQIANPALSLLVFDGNQSLSFPKINQGKTFFWVVNRGSPADVLPYFFGLSGTSHWGQHFHNMIFWGGSGPVTNGLQRRNGEEVSIGTIDNSFLFEPLIITLQPTEFQPADLIGKHGISELYFTGSLGEIIVYDRALSETEIETVEKCLGQKWGIALAGEEAPPDLTTGLVAHIPFDETSGNLANDVSGNNKQVTLEGYESNQSKWLTGKIGGALFFDGHDDRGSMPRPMGSKMTFAVWVNAYKTDDTSDYLFSGTLRGYGIGLHFGRPAIRVYETSFWKAASSSVLKNNWQHVAVTRNGTATNIFLNGVHDYSNTGGAPGAMGSTFKIGSNYDSSLFFSGLMDDLRVYERPLENNEIKALYDLGANPLATTTYAGTNPGLTLTPAAGSVTTAHLTEQILKYLRPEITSSPQATNVFADTNASFSVSAEGKYLTYQWKKNGADLVGETNSTLNITDANATLHDGNYTVVVSNDFGNVESGIVEAQVSDTLVNGLVGWWKFDETNGTVAYDSSGNGNDGNLTNGPTWVQGKIGGSLSFDGVDDSFIVNQDFFNSKSFSFSVWVKNSLHNKMILIHGSSPDPNRSLHLAFGNSQPSYLFFTFYTNDLVSTFIGDPGWSIITLTFDVSTNDRKMYANGNLISSDITPNAYTGNGPLMLGKRPWGDSTYYTEILDDVRIYDRALSAGEAQALYQLGQ